MSKKVKNENVLTQTSEITEINNQDDYMLYNLAGKNDLKFTEEQIYRIYKLSYETAKSRSTLKSTTTNEVIIEAMLRNNSYKRVGFETENKVPANWGKNNQFKVDVSTFKKDNLSEIVLAKAPACNIRQNKINSINALVGESMRLNIGENVKLNIINFLPNNTPFFTKDGRIKKFENNKPHFITRTNVNFNQNINEIYITFDIAGIEDCETKEDVNELFVNTNPITNVVVFINKFEKKA